MRNKKCRMEKSEFTPKFKSFIARVLSIMATCLSNQIYLISSIVFSVISASRFLGSYF